MFIIVKNIHTVNVLQALLLKWTQAMGAVTCPPFEAMSTT
jgi:hypothetical protein